MTKVHFCYKFAQKRKKKAQEEKLLFGKISRKKEDMADTYESMHEGYFRSMLARHVGVEADSLIPIPYEEYLEGVILKSNPLLSEEKTLTLLDATWNSIYEAWKEKQEEDSGDTLMEVYVHPMLKFSIEAEGNDLPQVFDPNEFLSEAGQGRHEQVKVTVYDGQQGLLYFRHE